jgi:hypothetical protein
MQRRPGARRWLVGEIGLQVVEQKATQLGGEPWPIARHVDGLSRIRAEIE